MTAGHVSAYALLAWLTCGFVGLARDEGRAEYNVRVCYAL